MLTNYHTSLHLPAEIRLKDFGSFHVGGRELIVKDRPVYEVDVNKHSGRKIKIDPNGTYRVEHLYAQYYLPSEQQSAFPLLMWHGGGMTGVAYESTPDGRPGWLNYFLRCGFPVYVSDAVERGRAGWSPYDPLFADEPATIFSMKYQFERFRLGSNYEEGQVFDNSRFPMEAYGSYSKQFVPRWTGSTEAIICAYCELLERVGPSVILGHSQGASLAFQVMQRRPELVKGLVAVEPYAVGDADMMDRIAHIPVLFVLGDNMEKHPAWAESKKLCYEFSSKLKAIGADSQILDLPKEGIYGNSHMLMMEKNNFEIADLIEDWLIEHGFTKPLA